MTLRKLLTLDASYSARLRLVPTRQLPWRLVVFLAHSGDSWFWMAGLFIIWLINRSDWHWRAALLAIGVGGLAVTVLAIKFLVRRQRPPGEWGAIYRNTDPHSFPSGHAARAFMLATLAAGIGPQWFAILLAFWAPLVSLARVATGVHYLSDVVAGAAMGVLAGWVLLLLSPWLMRLVPFLF